MIVGSQHHLPSEDFRHPIGLGTPAKHIQDQQGPSSSGEMKLTQSMSIPSRPYVLTALTAAFTNVDLLPDELTA